MKWMWIALLCCWAGQLKAQIFDQREKQKQQLVQQMAALVQWGRDTRQGYGQLDTGLRIIDRHALDEYTCHLIFYAGLAGINQQILMYVETHFPFGVKSLPWHPTDQGTSGRTPAAHP